MKCFVIQRPDGMYNTKRSWQALHRIVCNNSVTDDLEKAKHYKTRGGLARLQSIRSKEIVKELDRMNERLDDIDDCNVSDSAYRVKYGYHGYILKEDCRATTEHYLKEYEDDLGFLAQLAIIEVDVEYPSFVTNPMPEYKFSTDGGFGKVNRGGMFCKCCGIEIKGVGAYKFGKKGKATAKICVFCMSEKGAQATADLEAMDPAIREHIISERFVNKL